MSEIQMTPDEREYWRRMADPQAIVHILPSAIQFSVLGTSPLRWATGLLKVMELQRQMDRYTKQFWFSGRIEAPERKLDRSE